MDGELSFYFLTKVSKIGIGKLNQMKKPSHSIKNPPNFQSKHRINVEGVKNAEISVKKRELRGKTKDILCAVSMAYSSEIQILTVLRHWPRCYRYGLDFS